MNQPLTPAPVLSLEHLGRVIESNPLLNDLNLELSAGTRLAIMGQSGSGKTTLLHLASGMDQPDAGRVVVCGKVLSELPEPERTRWRAEHIGLVFQDFNLIDSLTVAENIEIPLWLCGLSNRSERIQRLAEALEITPLLERLPQALSGGEKQRVAIARALVHEPALLLADEPTGSLDEVNAAAVLNLFTDITQRLNCAVIVVTHDPKAAKTCDVVMQLKGGQLLPDNL